MVALVGFVGGTYQSRSTAFDAQRCINLYPETSESGSSKSPVMLNSTPGTKVWGNIPGASGIASLIRGMHTFDPNTLIVVAGPDVYHVTRNRMFEKVGEVESGLGAVYMQSNGTDIMISASEKGYRYTPEGRFFSELTLPVEKVGQVSFLDGSFLFNEPDSGRFWGSFPNSTTFDPLYFATAEGSPDQLVGSIADHREYWLFGSKTTEVWYNNGLTVGFPWQKLDGAFIEMGCAAKDSIAKADNSVFWLTADEIGQGTIVQATGFTPRRISTHPIESKIAKMEDISDAVAFTYQQEGHTFYQISFPTGNVTFVYDLATGFWHERSYRSPDGVFGRHRAQNTAFFDRKNLVGDYRRGVIYEYSLEEYSDNNEPLVRLRRTNYIAQDNSKVAHMSLDIDIEVGVGTFVGQGRDPEIMLRYSDDQGKTWSNQRRQSIGQGGNYQKRVRFTRLGSSRARVYEISVSDPVRVAIIGAFLNE